MASLYVTEYLKQTLDQNGLRIPAGEEPALATQKLAIGGASVASNPFDVRTRFVRLHSDAICSVKFGVTPSATTSDTRLSAESTEFFGVFGSGLSVAVIANT